MKEFEVEITETLQRTVTVEAESKLDAEQMVTDMWNSGDIVLDADDFIGADFMSNDGKEIEKQNKLEVLLAEPGQYAKMTEIDAGLSSMQNVVGGRIEAVHYFDEPVVLICNDEGKINGSELNRTIKDDSGKVIDIVAGTFFIRGEKGDGFASLPQEHRAKFEKMFRQPEAFLKMGKGIMAIPVESKKAATNKPAKSHEKEL